jgi:lysophospholipase
VSGLYQALTYEAGLSGGGWLLSSLAGNDWPTVTSLKENLWKPAFEVSLLLPNNLLAAEAYPMVTRDIVAKEAAGYPPTLVDPWGRLLSYQLLYGPDGGVTKTMSSVSAMSNLTSAAVPLPFITALGVKTFNGECLPGPNATQYEFSPYEFGSWDRDVSAFTPTRYLGTSLDNGKPTGAQCTANYDNLGYVLGTSSALFNNACQDVPPSPSNNNLTNTLAAIVAIAHKTTTRDEYAVYPNPFYHYYSPSGKRNPANDVPSQKELDLVDGGEALQNNPLWPFLQPARGIDVIIANDNSADDANNFPNGTEILTTFVQSLSAGLTRMPFIPSVDVFVSKGLNKRATAFGCDDNSKITVVWIPNVNYTYPSNQPTAKLQYSRAETDGMVGDGVAVATQNGDGDWGLCLRCLVVKKTAKKLPAGCAACFERYCYRP